MKNKWFLCIFLLIFFLGAFLRFYQLGFVPGSMDWDEVSFGYNAYSVLHTGKDEYGVAYPLLFRAFGEYKQPVYAYLDVASIDLFGLNAFAVRFPSALFGSISIIFVYLLVLELFKKFKFSKNLALLSMLFYAISPWSIQFSRIAFEANVALSLVIVSVWLFLKGLADKNKWYLISGTLILCLSEFTYISVKLLGPLLFISLIIYGFSFLKKQKGILIIVLLLFLLISAGGFLSSHSIARGEDVLFTNDQTQLLKSSVVQLQIAKQQHNILGEIIYNRRVIYAEKFAENYFSHYNPFWLTTTGDSVPRHHAAGMGNIYIVSFPFIILGIYFLLFRYFTDSWIIFIWFLIAPLASSLTSDAPSSLRSLLFLPIWQIFEASGIIFLFQMITKKNTILFLQIVLFCFYALNFYYYMNQYYTYTNYNKDLQKAWQFGYKDAVMFAEQKSNANKRIVFSNLFEQPYIFYLFYSQYSPTLYQRSGGSNRITKDCYTIDNAYFGNCKAKLRKGDYYIALQNESDQSGIKIKQINYANGDLAVVIYLQR
jgi:4-amino-4-deoxy-L-arabinose transferase-like glycosyltransferase